MIKISSYQVFDNCIGECVIRPTKCDFSAETKDEMEQVRDILRIKHKQDVEQHRAKYSIHKNMTDKETGKMITVYFVYKEI